MRKALFVILILVVSLPLAAQGMDPPPIAEAAHNRVAAFLQLSDEQIAEWDAIYRIHRDAEKPIQDEIAALQAEIEAFFEEGGSDTDYLGGLVIERHELGEALWEVHIVYHEAFVALLDETQGRKLRFIARADDVQQVVPAFKLFELIPR